MLHCIVRFATGLSKLRNHRGHRNARAISNSRYELSMDADHGPDHAFLEAVARLRAWTATIAPPQRCGEWECDYPAWPEIYAAWKAVLAAVPIEGWRDQLVGEALFALARDNESQILAGELTHLGAAALCSFTEAAVAAGEPDARWQLACELGTQRAPEVEPLLLRLAADGDEYVRRRALQSLARIGCRRVEELAAREWAEAADDLPWTRMNVLWVLHRISSPRLPALLHQALAAKDPHLRDYASKLRDGNVDQ